MKIIVACRHGEAFKNLKNIYGGTGSGLTPKGQQQITELGNKLKEICADTNLPVSIYASCKRVQILESADIIKNILGQETVNFSEGFSPIRLGVFDGMSREKQIQLYPEACAAHQLWEKGKLDIKKSEAMVEGMQPAAEYYDQVNNFMLNLPDNAIYILVGTRSDLSCLQNIVRGQHPSVDMQYKYYDFTYAQTIAATQVGEKIVEIQNNEMTNNAQNNTQNNPKNTTPPSNSGNLKESNKGYEKGE